MRDIEKENLINKIILSKIFKGIIVVFMIAFMVLVAACKEPPAVVEEQQEEEKPSEEIPSETIPKETKKETPPVIEEAPEEIEWEGMIITPIEGLRFDKGSFYAEAGNPYNLEAGEKAGVFVKDAVEINGVMESSIGLRPEVIEVMQKEIMEKDKEFKYPFPFDFEKDKGIKIKENKLTDTDEILKSHNLFWDDNVNLEILNVPLGAKIYSPLNTTYYLVWDNNLGRNDPNELSKYVLHFGLFPSAESEKNVLFKNERVDSIDLGIAALGFSLLPSGIEKNITEEQYFLLTETKIGEPIAELVSEGSIFIIYDICQFKNKDDKLELYEIDASKISKTSNLGLNGLLKIEDILVFLLPHDKKI